MNRDLNIENCIHFKCPASAQPFSIKKVHSGDIFRKSSSFSSRGCTGLVFLYCIHDDIVPWQYLTVNTRSGLERIQECEERPLTECRFPSFMENNNNNVGEKLNYINCGLADLAVEGCSCQLKWWDQTHCYAGEAGEQAGPVRKILCKH